jgi:DNA-binding IclR family transcriptional regulator
VQRHHRYDPENRPAISGRQHRPETYWVLSKTERMLMILERLTSGADPPTHAELMREMGIQRSTLSDSLAELRELGYVSMHERTYVPGPRLLTFVRGAEASTRLAAGVHGTLEQLSAATGETAVYVMASHSRRVADLAVVAIDQVESAQPIRYVASIGQPFPALTTAAGYVFLAFADQDAGAPDALRRPGGDDELLAAELERVRARGYATLVSASRPSTGIAAPVRDVNGSVIGVIDVVGPTDRLPDAAAIWPLLRDAAAELSGPLLRGASDRRAVA